MWNPRLSTQMAHKLAAEGLRAAAQLWIEVYLPMHFRPNAKYRYGYKPRLSDYNRKKHEYREVRDWHTKMRVPNPNYGQAPLDLVYTGSMREQVLSRAISGELLSRVQTPSAAVKQLVRIPVPIPHPMHPSISSTGLGAGKGELIRLMPDEIKAMATRALAVMRAKVTQMISGTETTTMAA